MAVPFIDIKRLENGFHQKWIEAVKNLSNNTAFIGGEVVLQLENSLSNICGNTNVVTCANGTDAMQLALRANDISTGDKVLIPDLTFWATFEAVVNVGALPILVDCNLKDQTLDIEKVTHAITQIKPQAVLIVHLYGWAAKEIKTLRLICEKSGIPLIEDSAQAFYVKVDNQSIFKDAHCATTSFYPAKVFGAAGDAGAVFCKDSELAEKIRLLTNHGRSTHYGYQAIGWNSRIDALQAAYLTISLEYLQKRVESRLDFAKRYQKELAGITGIKVASPPENIISNGYCNVCFIDDLKIKTELEARLKENQIGFANIYPSTMSEQPGAEPYMNPLSTNYCGDNAKWVCQHIINLPLFAYMREDEFKEVIDTVKSAFQF